MFRALILIEKPIIDSYSTLNRQILSQINGQIQQNLLQLSAIQNNQKLNNTQLFPKKSQLTHQIVNQESPQNHSRLPQQNRSKIHKKQTINKNAPQNVQNFILNVNKLKGKLKLFHQYRLQKSQNNFNQELVQNQIQQLVTSPRFQTNVLAIINISHLNLNIIFEKLQQVQNQIQLLDQVYGQSYENSTKQLQCLTCDIVVYFKNSLICGQFYKLCYQQLHVLPVFLQKVIILERNNLEQISYKDILKSLEFFPFSTPFQKGQNLNQAQNQENNKNDFQWIQLPKCAQCLLKLQFQVSGIDQKVLYTVSQHKYQTKITQNYRCNACEILTQHHKQTQIQRKLSYEQGYKDSKKSQKHAHCDDCKQKNDIWICMVCGSVGCGRYKNADAYKHFVNSGHIITIDLQTERVWNYLSDCFSHKILKSINESKKNFKFPQIDNNEGNNIENSKLEAAFWQYCSVFSDQMQRQRIFYENIKKSQQEKFISEKDKLEKIIQELQKQNEEKQLQLRRTLKKKSKMMKKQKQLESKINEERQILKEQEDCLSADFLKNQIQNDEEVMQKKREIQILDRQVNDLLIKLSQN